VAAQIGHDAPKVGLQVEANDIPGVRGERPAMQEDERRQARLAPLQVVDGEGAGPQRAVVRQRNVLYAEARQRGDFSQVGALFVRGQNARQYTLLYPASAGPA
jgi:hypothetical protein